MAAGQNYKTASQRFLSAAQQRNHNKPISGHAHICTHRCKYSLSGKKFVNEGIKPDIEIYPTIDDILEHNDVVLEEAVVVIRAKMQE